MVRQRCARASGPALPPPRDRRTGAAASGAHDPLLPRSPVSGRLVEASGGPLARPTVDVIETFARGSRPRRRTTPVQTDAEAGFPARPPPGPSRAVTAEFAGTPALTRAGGRLVAAGGPDGRPPARLYRQATVGGAPVVFSGQIAHPEATIPPEGRPVELQFRASGGALERVPHPPDRRQRPLPLRLLVQRRRQPRRPLPVPRLCPRAARLALRARRFPPGRRDRALNDDRPGVAGAVGTTAMLAAT